MVYFLEYFKDVLIQGLPTGETIWEYSDYQLAHLLPSGWFSVSEPLLSGF